MRWPKYKEPQVVTIGVAHWWHQFGVEGALCGFGGSAHVSFTPFVWKFHVRYVRGLFAGIFIGPLSVGMKSNSW